MLTALLSLIGGLVLLIWSADRFVEGACSAAEYAGMSPLLIGILIIGFGTSAPELIVSTTAALKGSSSIAIGNSYGSNITNIGLIAGLTALIKPIKVSSGIIKKEIPILFLATIISFVLIYDLRLERYESVLLLVLFCGLMIWGVINDRKGGDDTLKKETEENLHKEKMSLLKSVVYIAAGLVFLITASKLLISGAVFIAEKAGVSDLVIGLTIIAVGTSLPELASSLAAIKKGQHDLAIGNVVGSNLFNTLAVTGTAFSIRPSSFPQEILNRDFPVMLFMTLMIFAAGYKVRKEGIINRYEGGFLILVYLSYVSYLIFSA